ncbi:MAG TPA: alpha/beta fold hydrolase [Longimicrobium sp.]|nr:alpha/beta fold hydrolase [Longimicrobium sp.]
MTHDLGPRTPRAFARVRRGVGRRRLGLALLLTACAGAAPLASQSGGAEWRDASPHRSASVQANGINLHYLDWGGTGPALIFLTGMGVTPHIFDELAPRFTDRFRVLSLTRRGIGESDKPETGYDTGTLARDILGFMDALGIRSATLVGWSLGGTEITRVAAIAPERVDRLVYLDAAYDYGRQPELWAQDPVAVPPTEADLASLDAAREWFRRTQGMWSDAVEADARAINLKPDGTVTMEVTTPAINEQLIQGMVSSRPDFSRIRVPVLAFYAVTGTHPGLLSVTDPDVRQRGQAYWTNVYLPYQREQIRNLRAAVPDAWIVEVDAPHLMFIRPQDLERVAGEMQRFLAR